MMYQQQQHILIFNQQYKYNLYKHQQQIRVSIESGHTAKYQENKEQEWVLINGKTYQNDDYILKEECAPLSKEKRVSVSIDSWYTHNMTYKSKKYQKQ